MTAKRGKGREEPPPGFEIDTIEPCRGEFGYRAVYTGRFPLRDSSTWERTREAAVERAWNHYNDITSTADRHLTRIARIIEAVDNRAMAADGPVTPTLQEMTQEEISEIYKLARDAESEITK